MLTATLGTVLVLAQSAIGLPGHHVSGPGSCDSCGVEKTVPVAMIARLQGSPRWRERHNAAHALRRFDWQCHPEVVGALAYSLLNDPCEEVREEAAQSLTRMAPCLPVAHAALERAARCDPDSATRRWARRALSALGNRCAAACQVCGPAVVPAPAEPGLDLLAPGIQAVPDRPGPPRNEPGLTLPQPSAEPEIPTDAGRVPPADAPVEPLDPIPLVPPGGSAGTGPARSERPVVRSTASRGGRRPMPFFLRLPAAILPR